MEWTATASTKYRPDPQVPGLATDRPFSPFQWDPFGWALTRKNMIYLTAAAFDYTSLSFCGTQPTSIRNALAVKTGSSHQRPLQQPLHGDRVDGTYGKRTTWCRRNMVVLLFALQIMIQMASTPRFLAATELSFDPRLSLSRLLIFWQSKHS